MRTKTIALLVLLFLSYSGHSQSDSWPTQRCNEENSWFSFTHLAFCFDKSSISKMNQLNLSDPATTILFNRLLTEPGDIKLILIHLPSGNALERLSQHRGTDLKHMFKELTEHDNESPYSDILLQALWSDTYTDFIYYENDRLFALLIERNNNLDNTLYIKSPNHAGMTQLEGEFNSSQAEAFLSLITPNDVQ